MIRFLYYIKNGFHSDNFDMQMDCHEYKSFLKAIKPWELTEMRLDRIHKGIEEFRVTWERKCDPELVATYVKELYDVHNGKALPKLTVSVEGIITSK